MYHIMTNELQYESIIICNPINNICIVELNTINETEIPVDKLECPICFEIIEDNDGILIMECCNKKIHLKCLVNWYSNHPNNLVCIMCNQNNIFCNNLMYNETIIQISESNNSPVRLNNTQIDMPHWLHNTPIHYIFVPIIVLSFLLLIIIISIAVFL